MPELGSPNSHFPPEVVETMTRGEVADRANVSRETVRYYEKRGLIPRPPRTRGDYRTYDESFVERICFIKRAQELGFTLNQIKELLDLRISNTSDCADVREKAEAELARTRGKLRDLRSIETALIHLISACSGEGPTRNCPILDALGDEEAFAKLAR